MSATSFVRSSDLAPIKLGKIECGLLQLIPRRPVQFKPVLSDTDDLFFEINYQPWSLEVFATTRTELIFELNEQIAMLWSEYACESDDDLSDSALRIKRQLLNDFDAV